MRRKYLLLLPLCLSLLACGGVDPNSPMGKRQAIFKQMLKTNEDLGGMLRGRLPFDAARFQAEAKQLDELARQPWQHFPQIQDEGDSAAKADVWQRQERFQVLARELEATTAALSQASQAPSLTVAGLTPAQARVEAACKACHQEFRSH